MHLGGDAQVVLNPSSEYVWSLVSTYPSTPQARAQAVRASLTSSALIPALTIRSIIGVAFPAHPVGRMAVLMSSSPPP